MPGLFWDRNLPASELYFTMSFLRGLVLRCDGQECGARFEEYALSSTDLSRVELLDKALDARWKKFSNSHFCAPCWEKVSKELGGLKPDATGRPPLTETHQDYVRK